MQLASGGKGTSCRTCSILAIFGPVFDQAVLVQVLEAAPHSATLRVSKQLIRLDRRDVAGKLYREKWRRPYLRRWYHVAFIICDSGHHGSATPAPASATPSHLIDYSALSLCNSLSSGGRPSRAASCKLGLDAVSREDARYISIACRHWVETPTQSGRSLPQVRGR